jgi:hypothetical protein
LAQAPDGRIQRSQQADLADRQAAADEQQRQQAPGEPVVEVVDQAGLAAGRQRWLPQAGADNDFAGGEPFNAGGTQRSVGAGVGDGRAGGIGLSLSARLVHETQGHAQLEAQLGDA